jgi:hypothetical protein
LIDRRRLLEAMVGLLFAQPLLARAQTPAASPPKDASRDKLLAESPYVYVSPLRSNGEESRCHGEVWFGWLDDSVVVITGSKTWKARSLAKGLDRARIWVGDYGRVKKLMGSNEAFRSGTSFLARAEQVNAASTLDALLALYDKKYPAEIGNWRGPMRAGFQDRTRILIRYRPEPRT